MKNFCLTLENLKVNKKNVSSINKFFYNLNIEIISKKKRDKFLKKKIYKNFFNI